MAYESIVQGGGVLTQGYGNTPWAIANQSEWKCPSRGSRGYSFHAGIDIAARSHAVLLAVGYGVRVVRPRPSGSCGGLGPFAVCINSGPVDIWYGHGDKDLVGVGAQVAPGTPLMLMDSIGCSTGTHVHFEVQPAGHVNGCDSLDPTPYLRSWPGLPPPGPPPPPPPPPDPGGGPAPSPQHTGWLLAAGAGAALLLAARRRS